MILKKIISGGQTGADRGGLIIAKTLGIKTGGKIPLGFLTENGSEPELGTKYGLEETASDKYPPRTFANAHDSNGTMRFASNFGSPGERCTLNAIKEYTKPHLDVDVDIDGFPIWETTVSFEAAANWIQANNIEVLNVAGNRESKCPGIELFVRNFLAEVLKLLEKEDG